MTDLSAVKESDYEESKATVEDFRQRLDEEFSLKRSEAKQTPKMREKSPSFYDVDESQISRRELNTSLSQTSDIKTAQKQDIESTRNEGTRIEKLQRVEPLNLQRDVDLMIMASETKPQLSTASRKSTTKENSVKSKYDDFMNFLDNVE